MREFENKKLIVRIGHGARLIRSQLVNGILDLGLQVEMVDETGTTPILGKGTRQVISILLRHKYCADPRKIVGKQFIEPSHGEVRVIQESSRSTPTGARPSRGFLQELSQKGIDP